MNANNPTGENGKNQMKKVKNTKEIKIVKDSKEAESLLEKFFGEKDYAKIHLNCTTLEMPEKEIHFKTEDAKKIEIAKSRFERDKVLSIKTTKGQRKQERAAENERER